MNEQIAKLDRLRRAMERDGIDVLLTLKPEHSFYLSGFNPIIYSHPVIALLPRDGAPRLIIHALRDDHARASSWVDRISLYGKWSTKETMGPDWRTALAANLAELGLESATIGIEHDHVPVARMRELEQLLPAARWKDSSRLFLEARSIKSAPEIRDARIAADIANIGMDAAVAALASGGSERDVSLAAQSAMGRHWADTYPDVEIADFGSLEGGVFSGLWCWVLSGDRMFLNADVPTNRVPQPGDTTSVLIWTNANGTHAEIERTIAHGPLPEIRRNAMNAILELRAETIPLLRPGTPISALFEACRASLEKRGYGANVPGRVGHGIGLGAHEALSLDAASPYTLEPGMLITYEPNLRVAPHAATQISDTVLITDDGHEFLTHGHEDYVQV